MSVSDGKPLTYEEQIELFREKAAYAFWTEFLLFNWGLDPVELFALMDAQMLAVKNSAGVHHDTPDQVWDWGVLGSVPALEMVLGRIKSKLSAP